MKPSPDGNDPKHIDSILFSQVFDMVDIGLVILDRGLRVRYWNRWMQQHSAIAPERIIGSPLSDIFPNLNRPWFLSNCQAVFTFGNFCFFFAKASQLFVSVQTDQFF